MSLRGRASYTFPLSLSLSFFRYWCQAYCTKESAAASTFHTDLFQNYLPTSYVSGIPVKGGEILDRRIRGNKICRVYPFSSAPLSPRPLAICGLVDTRRARDITISLPCTRLRYFVLAWWLHARARIPIRLYSHSTKPLKCPWITPAVLSYNRSARPRQRENYSRESSR